MKGGEERKDTQVPRVRILIDATQSHTEERIFEAKFSQSVILLGRDPTNDLQIPFPAVGRFHARIFFECGDFFLEDQEGSSGTKHNQYDMKPRECRWLKSGDTIQISAFNMTFSVVADAKESDSQAGATRHRVWHIAQQLLGQLESTHSVQLPALRVMNGPSKGLRSVLSLEVPTLLVGRSLECDVTLPDENISRRHCLVRRGAHGVTVEDLDSRNGVMINGRRLTQACCLHDGDELVLGPIKLSFLDPPSRLVKAFEGTPKAPVHRESQGAAAVDQDNFKEAEVVDEGGAFGRLSETDRELLDTAAHVSGLEMVIWGAGAVALLSTSMFILMILI